MEIKMSNKLLDYLVNHSLKDLEISHGVLSRRSVDNSKFSLNYDQFSSSSGDEIAELCRGVVLRPKSRAAQKLLNSDSWSDYPLGECYYLARTMKRFYNHGDFYAAKVDFGCPSLQVMEKLDGTMVALYYDDLKDNWYVATRSVPEADLPFMTDEWSGKDTTFSDLFWDGYQNSVSSSKDLSILDKEYTYIFEVTSSLNKIVVSYDKTELTLLAIVHNLSGQEVDIYSSLGQRFLPSVTRPKTWKMNNISDIISFVNSKPANEFEGVVLRDGNFNRIKIKSASYVLTHRSKDILDNSPTSALMSVLDGSIDDVLPLLDKETSSRFKSIQEKVAKYFIHLEFIFNEAYRKTSSRKEFALYISSLNEWSAPLFGMYQISETDKSSMVLASHWVTSLIKKNRFTPSLTKELLKRIQF